MLHGREGEATRGRVPVTEVVGNIITELLNRSQRGDRMKQAERRKFHYIYKITRDDGKYYIGMHSTDNLDDGYFGSGQLLWKSIKKHGKEKHTKEILEFLPSRRELALRESELVTRDVVDDVMCLNLKLGGRGDDNKQRTTASALMKGVWGDPEKRTTYSKSMSASAAKRWESDVEKQRASDHAKRNSSHQYLQHGRKKWIQEHPEEFRQQQGSTTRGKFWITNGQESKMSNVIPEGWRKGRHARKL